MKKLIVIEIESTEAKAEADLKRIEAGIEAYIEQNTVFVCKNVRVIDAEKYGH